MGSVRGIGALLVLYRCFRQAVCWRVEGNRTVTCFPVDYVRNFQISLRVEKPFWHCHCPLLKCHITFFGGSCCRFISFPIKLVLPGAMKIAESAPKDLGTVVTGLLTNAVANPISALVEGNYLAILFWSLLIGSGLRLTSATTKKVVTELAETVSSVAQNVIQFAPFGIVGLLHESLSKTGVRGVMAYGQLLILLVATMVFVYLVVYPFMVWLLTRQNPYPLTFWTLKVSGIRPFSRVVAPSTFRLTSKLRKIWA